MGAILTALLNELGHSIFISYRRGWGVDYPPITLKRHRHTRVIYSIFNNDCQAHTINSNNFQRRQSVVIDCQRIVKYDGGMNKRKDNEGEVVAMREFQRHFHRYRGRKIRVMSGGEIVGVWVPALN